MEIGGTTKTLNLSSTELGKLVDGWSGITFGRGDMTGTMTIDANTYTDNTSFITGSGVMTVAGAVAMGANSLTLQTDSDLTLSAALSGTGTLTVKPSATATTMSLNGGAGTLALSTAELNNLATGWSSLNFGRSDGSGLMRVGNYNWADSVNYLNGSANIQFDSGTSTLSVNKSLTASASSGSITNSAASTITTSGTGAITLSTPVSLSGNLTLNTPARSHSGGLSTAAQTSPPAPTRSVSAARSAARRRWPRSRSPAQMP